MCEKQRAQQDARQRDPVHFLGEKPPVCRPLDIVRLKAGGKLITRSGTKELLAVVDGYRESTQFLA